MTFSIVIPAYNEEAMIGRAIESLRRQKFPRKNYEIIVVDGDSTDDTIAVARRAGADRVVIEKKKGTNIARNRGYLMARGEYVAFLDSDSEAPADWLSRIEKHFTSSPDVAAVSGPYDYGFTGFQKITESWYTRWLLPRVPELLHFLFRKKAGVMLGGNFTVRRSVLKEIGGLPPISFWGDDATLAMIISRRSGNVVFDPDLRVKSSPRRFERDGFLPLAFHYARAYLGAYFTVE